MKEKISKQVLEAEKSMKELDKEYNEEAQKRASFYFKTAWELWRLTIK